MINGDFQQDLFDGNDFNEEKGRRGRTDRSRKRFYLTHIQFPIENVVIILIVFMVLVIVAYAVGVEKGKRMSRVCSVPEMKEAPEYTISAYEKEPLEEEMITDTTESIEENTYIEEESPQSEDYIAEDEGIISDNDSENDYEPLRKGYTVQLVSYKDENRAIDEVSRLRGQGHNADYQKSGDWYQVYSYGYHDIDAAINAKESLSENYRDCYIRKIR